MDKIFTQKTQKTPSNVIKSQERSPTLGVPTFLSCTRGKNAGLECMALALPWQQEDMTVILALFV